MVAVVCELGMLALLYVDRPIGVIALFAYIGGMAHALASSDASSDASGTAEWMHLQLLLTVLATLLNVTNRGGFVSSVLRLRNLTPFGFLKVGFGAVVLGAVSSFALCRDGIPKL